MKKEKYQSTLQKHETRRKYNEQLYVNKFNNLTQTTF